IKPLLDDLVMTLNAFLLPDDNLTITYVDPTPEDVERKLKELETSHKIGAMTTNEKREILGLDPIEDGDKILVPMNLIPMDSDETSTEE
ncbi:MAG: hypothetical protein ACOC5T_08865, partial [Elusimicrobiota bacterium]